MTLSEMADFVCGKVRQTDANSVTRCKTYLRRRYEMICQEELWRDLVWQYSFTFTPNTVASPESYGGIYMFPTVVDKVLAIRRAEGGIDNVAAESLFRFDTDWWAQTGFSINYVHLPPCVAILPDAFSFHDLRIYAGGGDSGLTWKVVFLDSEQVRHTVSNTFSTSGVAEETDNVRIVEKVTKPTTEQISTLTTNQGDQDLVVCPADSVTFPVRIPVQLIPWPDQATDFRALVKKKVVPLDDDNAETEVRGVDNCLMAFAQGDMLERARQYGKAQAVAQEAVALLRQLKTVAVVQEETTQQIVPRVETMSGTVDGEFYSKEWW